MNPRKNIARKKRIHAREKARARRRPRSARFNPEDVRISWDPGGDQGVIELVPMTLERAIRRACARTSLHDLSAWE